MSYGKTLKYIRLRKGYTQKQIAFNIVTDSFIAKFEKGDTNISFDLLLKILDGMCVSLEEFVELDKLNNINENLKINDCIECLEKTIVSNNFKKANDIYNHVTLFSNPLCDFIKYLIEYIFFNKHEHIKFIKESISEWDYVGHAEMILFNISLRIIDINFSINILHRILRMHNNTNDSNYCNDRNKIYITILKMLLEENNELLLKSIVEDFFNNLNGESLLRLNYHLDEDEKNKMNQILNFDLFQEKVILLV